MSAPGAGAGLTVTEQAVAAIWRSVLDAGELGADDNFFALGGRSLAAMKVVAQVRSQIGVPVTLADVFRAPTLRSFAELVQTAKTGDEQEGR